MAETTFTWADESGYELERDGKYYLVFGSITATFTFWVYHDESGYEYSDETLEEYEIEIESISDDDENVIETELTESEYFEYKKYMKNKARDYFEDSGFAEFVAQESECREVCLEE